MADGNAEDVAGFVVSPEEVSRRRDIEDGRMNNMYGDIQFSQKERCITCGRCIDVGGVGQVSFLAPAAPYCTPFGHCCCIDCFERAEKWFARQFPKFPSTRKGRPLASTANLTNEAMKPWEALGMIRRTWYRQKQKPK